MRLKTLLLPFLFLPLLVLGQTSNPPSDLRSKVDSLIRYEIGYVIDSTTNVLPERKWDPDQPRGLYPDFASLPANPMPLIVLDGEIVALEDLDQLQLPEVGEIHIYSKEDSVTTAIYGLSAVNGAVVILTKE